MLIETVITYSAYIRRGRERTHKYNSFCESFAFCVREMTALEAPVAARLRKDAADDWVELRLVDGRLFMSQDDAARAPWIEKKRDLEFIDYVAQDVAETLAAGRTSRESHHGRIEDVADLKDVKECTRDDRERAWIETAADIVVVDGKIHTVAEEPVLLYCLGDKLYVKTKTDAMEALNDYDNNIPYRLDQADYALSVFEVDPEEPLALPFEIDIPMPEALHFPSDQWFLLNMARILHRLQQHSGLMAFGDLAGRPSPPPTPEELAARKARSDCFESLWKAISATQDAFKEGHHDASRLALAVEAGLPLAPAKCSNAVALCEAAIERLREGTSTPDEGLSTLM
jgi:hypothetical protein